MKNFVYSATTNAFYPVDMKSDYDAAGTWPTDGLEVSDEVFQEFTSSGVVGKYRAPGDDGLPAWIDIPALTKDEEIAKAESERSRLIGMVNAYINSKQWPGKAAIGRLKGDELAQYNLWLDYFDLLEAVDTSAAPDITWPVTPQ